MSRFSDILSGLAVVLCITAIAALFQLTVMPRAENEHMRGFSRVGYGVDVTPVLMGLDSDLSGEFTIAVYKDGVPAPGIDLQVSAVFKDEAWRAPSGALKIDHYSAVTYPDGATGLRVTHMVGFKRLELQAVDASGIPILLNGQSVLKVGYSNASIRSVNSYLRSDKSYIRQLWTFVPIGIGIVLFGLMLHFKRKEDSAPGASNSATPATGAARRYYILARILIVLSIGFIMTGALPVWRLFV